MPEPETRLCQKSERVRHPVIGVIRKIRNAEEEGGGVVSFLQPYFKSMGEMRKTRYERGEGVKKKVQTYFTNDPIIIKVINDSGYTVA